MPHSTPEVTVEPGGFLDRISRRIDEIQRLEEQDETVDDPRRLPVSQAFDILERSFDESWPMLARAQLCELAARLVWLGGSEGPAFAILFAERALVLDPCERTVQLLHDLRDDSA